MHSAAFYLVSTFFKIFIWKNKKMMSFSIPSSVETDIRKTRLHLTRTSTVLSSIKNKKAPPTNCKGAI